MRFLSTTTNLLLASLVALSAATITFVEPLSGTLHVGDKHRIRWSESDEYIVHLHLLEKTELGNNFVRKYFHNRVQGAGDGANYVWTVPNVVPGSYALYLSGEPDSTSEYQVGAADFTPWFTIAGGTAINNNIALSRAEIAGIIVAAIGGLASIIAGVWFFVRRRRAAAARNAPLETTGTPPMEQRPADGRESMDSIDSIEVEKERARLAVKEVEV